MDDRPLTDYDVLRSKEPLHGGNRLPDSFIYEDALLTDVEVAKMLGISPRTVRAWRLKKTGPPFRKIGRLVRYERSKVQEWFGLASPAPKEE